MSNYYCFLLVFITDTILFGEKNCKNKNVIDLDFILKAQQGTCMCGSCKIARIFGRYWPDTCEGNVTAMGSIKGVQRAQININCLFSNRLLNFFFF